jgi:MYXO-CTERM domain-containing protein
MKSSITAACLAAALATAWSLIEGAHAKAFIIPPSIPVEISVTPTVDLSDAWFTIYYPPAQISPVTYTITTELGGVTFPAGQTTTVQFTATLPYGDSYDPADNVNDLYGFAAVYNGGGVTIGFDQADAASDIGQDFSSIFTTPTESSLEASLSGGDFDDGVEAFYNNNDSTTDTVPLGTQMGLVNFTDGTNGGSLSAEVVLPEPAGMGLLVAAASTLLRPRRRRSESMERDAVS